MTPSTPNQPAPAMPEHSASPGALRAVAIIRDALFDDATIGKHSGGENDAEWRALAAIIDRETNHAALVAALEQAVARVQLANEEGNPILSAWLPEARAAIRNATK